MKRFRPAPLPAACSALATLCVVCGASAASAQTPALPHCDGQVISSVVIQSSDPAFKGATATWQALARGLGLHHVATHAHVIRDYLLVREGQPCTAARLSESERVLRSLPFLASATVSAVPDTGGTVAVLVQTEDEVPILASGAVRHGKPAAIGLGSENIGGEGLRAMAGVERGFAYRTGYHLQLEDFGALDEPITLGFEGERLPLGGDFELESSHPFLSNLQRTSWQASYGQRDDYIEFRRPADDHLALPVQQERWAVGGGVRVDLGSSVWLIGATGIGTSGIPATTSVVVTDTGLATDSDQLVADHYQTFHSVHIGPLLGLRHVHYTTIRGLDALFATQDVMTGEQVGVVVAPGTVNSVGSILLGTSAYMGWTGGSSVFAVEFDGESRRDLKGGAWDSSIGSGRASWYLRAGHRAQLHVTDLYTGGANSRLPLQLDLGDRIGGVRGYAGSTLAGARRNVVRIEGRLAQPSAIHHADVGAALFADIGTLWAGSVPYGVSTTRTSIGVSLMTAYPSGSKRLYRIDLAIPLQRTTVGGGIAAPHAIELRFSSGDPTAAFWTEPEDVSRARLSPGPTKLFTWPVR
jgi:hypothetical protein